METFGSDLPSAHIWRPLSATLLGQLFSPGIVSPPASFLPRHRGELQKDTLPRESLLAQTHSLRQNPEDSSVFRYHRDKRCWELERSHWSGRKRVSQYAQCEPEENESLFYLDRQALVGKVGESREERRDHREQAERNKTKERKAGLNAMWRAKPPGSHSGFPRQTPLSTSSLARAVKASSQHGHKLHDSFNKGPSTFPYNLDPSRVPSGFPSSPASYILSFFFSHIFPEGSEPLLLHGRNGFFIQTSLTTHHNPFSFPLCFPLCATSFLHLPLAIFS